jgi:drug/metabolite transporter (DMT)-like permease
MRAFLFWALAFLWGGSFIAIKVVVATVPPVWGAAFRLTVALLSLTLYYELTKKNLKIVPHLRRSVILSGLASQGIPFALLFWGEQSISPGLSGILNGTTPIWAFIFGMLFLRKHEPFTLKKFLGLIVGMAGIFIIFGPKLANGFSNSSTLGTIAVGFMGLSYGLGTVINKSVMVHKDHPTLEASLFWQTVAAVVFVGLVAFSVEGLPSLSWFGNPQFILSTMYMGCLSTALAFVLYFRLLHELGPVKASAIAYLIPVTALLLDFIINKTVPTGSDVLGAGVILTGIFIIQDRKLGTY